MLIWPKNELELKHRQNRLSRLVALFAILDISKIKKTYTKRKQC